MHQNSAGKKNWIFCNIHVLTMQWFCITEKNGGRSKQIKQLIFLMGNVLPRSYYIFTSASSQITCPATRSLLTRPPHIAPWPISQCAGYYPIHLNSQCYPVRSISDQDGEFYPIPLNSQCYPLLSSTFTLYLTPPIFGQIWLSSACFLKKNQHMYCSDKCFLFFLKPFKWKRLFLPSKPPL